MKPIRLAAILAAIFAICCALPACAQTPAAPPSATPAPAPADTSKDNKDTAAIKPAPAIAPSDIPQGPLPSPGDQFDPKDIQKGSEADVNAIGNRDIGARGPGNWYSTNWEIGMGSQYSQEVLKSSHMITDPVVTEYVNRIGQNIVKNSDAKVPFTIRVIDSDEINAFALPGGFFFVNSGLILAADEESELAGVMAHEISHVIAHHAAREMTRANYAQIASVPLIFMGGWTGYGLYEASQIAVPMTFLEFSRTFEAEADYLGVQYMYKSGYDPQGMITMFEKLEALEKQKPGSLAKAFEDHPPTGDRIVSIENEIATILPPRPDYVETTSEFDDVKARLARIENKRKTNDGKGGTTPTLRRVGGPSDPNSTSGSGTDQGSDRPTLHPRND
jgi:beta-barrel assembly-enhancing protease